MRANTRSLAVMARLGLAIHEFRLGKTASVAGKLVDPKAKPWDDGDTGQHCAA